MEQIKISKIMLAYPWTDNSSGEIDLHFGADLYRKVETGKNVLFKDGLMGILSVKLVEAGTGPQTKES